MKTTQLQKNCTFPIDKSKLMETTIRINTDMLTADMVEGIKKMFPHKTVDITIQYADDTDYILSNPAFAQELQERIADYQTKKDAIVVKSDELL